MSRRELIAFTGSLVGLGVGLYYSDAMIKASRQDYEDEVHRRVQKRLDELGVIIVPTEEDFIDDDVPKTLKTPNDA